MNDKIFIDSNVLIYAHTDLDLHKQSIAQEIITMQKKEIIEMKQLLKETK